MELADKPQVVVETGSSPVGHWIVGAALISVIAVPLYYIGFPALPWPVSITCESTDEDDCDFIQSADITWVDRHGITSSRIESAVFYDQPPVWRDPNRRGDVPPLARTAEWMALPDTFGDPIFVAACNRDDGKRVTCEIVGGLDDLPPTWNAP